jgi:xylose isomerase
MLNGKVSLDQIEAKALHSSLNPQPRSGRQEQIENLLIRQIYSDPTA